MASGSSQHTFERSDQKAVLLQLQNTGLPIRSRQPGFRILGFFESREDAKDYVKRFIEPVFGPDETGALWALDAHAPVMIAQTTDRMFDDEYQKTKLIELCKIREDWNVKRKKEFEERRKMKNLTEKERQDREASIRKKYSNPYRNVGNSTAVGKKTTRAKALAKELKRKRETERANAEARNGPTKSAGIDGPWPRQLELRDQNFAAICILDDVSQLTRKNRCSPEPFIWFWQAFEDEKDANCWVQECGQKVYEDPPMDVIDLYKWYYPTLLDLSKMREVYPDKELQSFMEQHKNQAQEMASFEKWQRQQGLSTRGISPAEYQRQLKATAEVETKVASEGLLPPKRIVGKGPESLLQEQEQDQNVEMFDPRNLQRILHEDQNQNQQ